MVTLTILDDHGLLVDSLASWFAANTQDFTVDVAETSWSACLANSAFPSQVVLMDYQLAESVSIEARVLTCKAAGSRIVVMSALASPELEERVLAAGADAFFDKSTSMNIVAAKMRTLLGMKPAVVDSSGSSSHPAQHAEELVKPRLSAGEEQAFVLYCRGLATKEVAESMNVQFETAKTYLRRVREKYARAGRPASRRADLVRRAAEDGYLT